MTKGGSFCLNSSGRVRISLQRQSRSCATSKTRDIAMWDWLSRNRDWVFSGVGVAVVAGVIAFVRGQKGGHRQHQQSGAHSRNIQAGGDIRVNDSTDNNKNAGR